MTLQPFERRSLIRSVKCSSRLPSSCSLSSVKLFDQGENKHVVLRYSYFLTNAPIYFVILAFTKSKVYIILVAFTNFYKQWAQEPSLVGQGAMEISKRMGERPIRNITLVAPQPLNGLSVGS